MRFMILSFGVIATIIDACTWKEFLPPPNHGCVRLFHHNDQPVRVHEPTEFLIFNPATCGDTNSVNAAFNNISSLKRDALGTCPDVAWTGATNTEGDSTVLINPPAFYKISIRGANSFIHEVEMEPTSNNDFYTFTVIPIEEGKATASIHVDFDGCVNMLAMNPLDFYHFGQTNKFDTDQRGCKGISFSKLATYGMIVHPKPLKRVAPPNDCDWSLMRGGWWINEIGQTNHFDTPCHPKTFKAQGNASSTVAPMRRVCVIGDSHVKNNWKIYYEPRAPPRIQPFLSGGGLDLDAHRLLESWAHGHTSDTSGLVAAALTNSHNPWAPCVEASPQASTIVFHIGSHNCGASVTEGRSAVTQLVKRFERWADESSATGDLDVPQGVRRKCLLLVSSLDMRHESIGEVKEGKFGDQAQIRNSFRTASLNTATRRAVSEAKEAWRIRHPQRKQGLNVHFVDEFHYSLGLHWMGHSPADPVHLINVLNRPLADLMYAAELDLCGA